MPPAARNPQREAEFPFVSVITPTYNRRTFIPRLIDCFVHQTYPKDRMEWMIQGWGVEEESWVLGAGVASTWDELGEALFRTSFGQRALRVRACAVEEALWCIRTRQPGWERRDEAWVDRHLADLTFMRLRHTVVTMLYRAGATIPEIAAITGHPIASVTGIIERYGVRDEITAGNAFQKRLDREGI